jgi:hypothetical protein
VERFFTPARTWPLGCSRLHLYLVPPVPVIAAIKKSLLEHDVKLEQYDYLSVVPTKALHITVTMLKGKWLQQITRSEMDHLRAIYREVVQSCTGVRLMTDKIIVGQRSVKVELSEFPGESSFRGLERLVKEASVKILGDDSARYEVGTPHVTLAYGSAAADSRPLEQKISIIQLSNQCMPIDSMQLVEGMQNLRTSRIDWHTIDVLPFGRL